MEVNTRFEPQQASCQLEAPTIVWFSASIKHFIVLLLHVLGQQKRERFVEPDREVRPSGNTNIALPHAQGGAALLQHLSRT